MLIRSTPTVRRIALPLLAALMLMLQALGLLHAVMHGMGHGIGHGAGHVVHATSVASHDGAAGLFFEVGSPFDHGYHFIQKAISRLTCNTKDYRV